MAFLTTFYMFRLFFVVFLGKAKSDHVEHAHESPPVMAYPLIVLAVASVVGGFFGIAQFVAPQFSPTAAEGPIFAPLEPFRAAPAAALLGLAAFAVGFAPAYYSLRRRRIRSAAGQNESRLPRPAPQVLL